jgi:mannose-6-phosphate isomerase
MYSLRPALQPYAWGTPGDIPELLGLVPTGAPVAEAWWGDHPLAPARCATDGVEVGLDRLIAADPDAALGARLAREYEGRLPFLLKILAIGSPLSIQAHPSVRAAAVGFAREDAAAIPIDSPRRTYRDRNHKPELLVALTPMVVLSGFRPRGEIRRDVERLEHPEAPGLATLLAAQDDDGGAIASFVRRCLESSDARGLVAAVVRSASAEGAGGSVRAAAAAAAHYPADGGVLVALAMNRLDLEPGEACFTPDGIVHSYQSGVGLEIMANSDNVVRAGLTPKHVDIDELLAVASTLPAPPVRPRATRIGGADAFPESAAEFALSLVRGGVGNFPAGPRMVLVLEGEATVSTERQGERTLARGDAAFVPFADGRLAVAAQGLAAVAGCPEPLRAG